MWQLRRQGIQPAAKSVLSGGAVLRSWRLALKYFQMESDDALSTQVLARRGLLFAEHGI